MEWIEPKTDWFGETVNGEYRGDRFNVSDYKRITNNISYLAERLNKMQSETLTQYAMVEKTYESFLYADDFNNIESNLKFIEELNMISLNHDFYPGYVEDSFIPDYNELNKIEMGSKEIYEKYIKDYYALYEYFPNTIDKSNGGKKRVLKNSAYKHTIKPDSGYTVTISNVTLTMGGVDVKSKYYDNSTKTINIPQVTGDLRVEVRPQRR